MSNTNSEKVGGVRVGGGGAVPKRAYSLSVHFLGAGIFNDYFRIFAFHEARIEYLFFHHHTRVLLYHTEHRRFTAAVQHSLFDRAFISRHGIYKD